MEASGGVVLLVCAVVALAWANSPLADAYASLWQTRMSIRLGGLQLAKPLHLWINDGLMAVFFLLIGLEIKREFLVGELSSSRQAALPIVAAFGGMVVPASLYASFNAGKPGAPGWGIPMATDIAFALGVLALLGKRIPVALKVFLTALAIADDLGAVVVIASFYTSAISWACLACGAGILLLLAGVNWAGVRNPLVFGLLGATLWLAFLESGVHATVAGILLAMTIPSRARVNVKQFAAESRALLTELETADDLGEGVPIDEQRRTAIQALETACERAETPMHRLEHALHPWVTYAIMPIFALANAGVALRAALPSGWTHPVALGVVTGLVLGKPLGITLFAWLAVRSGLAVLPAHVTWRQLHGVAWLGGIGFTMSLFIANLAFGQSSLLESAKVGVLLSGLVAGMAGWTILRTSAASEPTPETNG